MPQQTVTVVVYVLNEMGNLQIMMPRIKREWYDQLIVIDGGSKDGSVEWLKSQGYEVYRQQEPRWSGAYMEAYRRATGDIIVDFSPDGNSIPELIPDLIKKMREGYDMVIASRYFGGAKSEDDTAITGFGNAMFTGTINLLFGGRYTDSLVIFRAYSKNLLEKGGFLEKHLDQCVTGLLSIRCAKIKGKFADIPGDEPLRLHGHRKMNIMVDGLRVLTIVLKEFILYPIGRAQSVVITW